MSEDESAARSSMTDESWAACYDQLKSVASQYFEAERKDHTLQPTAIVHEAWIRLSRSSNVDASNREHFFAAAATAVRRILVDHARARKRARRGGGFYRIVQTPPDDIEASLDVDLTLLDEAMTRLGRRSQRQLRIIELRCFGGLDLDKTAEVLGVSRSTVKEEWRFARAWLHNEVAAE